MIVFMTRYSILDKTCTAFRNTNITSDARMDFKRSIFSKVTLPSIVGQTDKNWKWFIYVGSWLKDKEFEQWLHDCDPRIIVRFVDTYQEFTEWADTDSIGNTTIRLDDDDGLSKRFVEKIRKYEDQMLYQIISFPNGEKFDGSKRKPHHQKNISAGLTRINGSIYKCGNHTKVHEKYTVHYDLTPKMYSFCCSEFCDTQRKF